MALHTKSFRGVPKLEIQQKTYSHVSKSVSMGVGEWTNPGWFIRPGKVSLCLYPFLRKPGPSTYIYIYIYMHTDRACVSLEKGMT